MEYLYCFANASLTLRAVEYVSLSRSLPVEFATVVHQPDCWLLRLKFGLPLPSELHLNLQAVLLELGRPYQPGRRVQLALWSLELGESVVKVMQRYQVAVISHGLIDMEEILEFRRQFISGLGYCPASLA